MDGRERRYCICSGSNISEGLTNISSRFRQESEKPNTEPESLTLLIDQPKSCELYYDCCMMVDRHNRCRQTDLKLKEKILVFI